MSIRYRLFNLLIIWQMMILVGWITPCISASAEEIHVPMTAENGWNITASSLEIQEAPGTDLEMGVVIDWQNGYYSLSTDSDTIDVVSWWNDKASGYNDNSINGDRTTFDRAADSLQAAVRANMRVCITNGVDEFDVIFPNVLIGYETSSAGIRWWFGQTQGQHTKDSDEDDTVLLQGITSDAGSIVYASVRCDDTINNEILVEQIAIIPEAREENHSVTDVTSIIQSVATDASLIQLSGCSSTYENVVNHIQGATLYVADGGIQYSILTHSVKTATYAHILAGAVDGSMTGYKSYGAGWRHPGGIQVIGDYLFVPTEEESQAYITVYDLRSLVVGELRRVENILLTVNHKAGSLGITQYTDDNGDRYYLLAVANSDGENSVYYFYISPIQLGIENAQFVSAGSASINVDFQGLGLVEEQDTGDVYMVGLYSKSKVLTYEDYIYLYSLNCNTWNIEDVILTRHIKSTGTGITGVHFRYGASVEVTDAGAIVLTASERNIGMSGKLTLNTWR